MEDKFTLEYADGYYIALNGEGVIDFTEDKAQNYEFCSAICSALNLAYQIGKISDKGVFNVEIRGGLDGLYNS